MVITSYSPQMELINAVTPVIETKVHPISLQDFS